MTLAFDPINYVPKRVKMLDLFEPPYWLINYLLN